MKKVLSVFFMCLSSNVFSQNYDVLKNMAENPSYILDEYFEVIQKVNGQTEMMHYLKYFFQGSTIEKKEYYLGTPFYQNQEWHKGVLKMPGQQPVEGLISYNQVFHRVYFKSINSTTQRQQVSPEYFSIGGTTFTNYPEIDLLSVGYFKPVLETTLSIVCRSDKVQSNDINASILDAYNIADRKYKATFVEQLVFFVILNEDVFKVENKNYFYKKFNKTKKDLKAFVADKQISFNAEEDVKRLIEELLN